MDNRVFDMSIDYTAFNIKKGNELPFLTSYVGYTEQKKRPAVIVCPGGGYCFLSSHEGEPIALAYASFGYAAFVLNYSIYPAEFPAALLELCKAVAFVRKHADEWNIDSKRIYICGFSAGGHLAASCGILWNRDFVKSALNMYKGEHRPNGMILCYPVISSDKFAHSGSIDALLGEKRNDKTLLDTVSLEKQVDADTPSAFIWHTSEDSCVPVENSLLLSLALSEKGRPFELHVYPFGCHGLGLKNIPEKTKNGFEYNDSSDWLSLSVRGGLEI